MRQLLFAFTFAAFASGSVAWAKLPFLNEDAEGSFRPYVYEFEAQLTHSYRVLVIEHDSSYGVNSRSQEGQAIMQLIYKSREIRRSSFRQTMTEVYPDKTPAQIEAILDKVDANDRPRSLHSSRIIVLEGGVPLEQAHVIAGLRLAMDGDNGLGLELEDALPGYRYPRKWEMRISFGRKSDWVNQDHPEEPARFVQVEPAHWLAHLPELTGGTIQLTNFFNNGAGTNAPEIGALLNFVASQISLRRPESMPWVHLNQTMKDEYNRLVEGRVLTPEWMQLMPMEVAAYADRRLAVNYYMRVMKFKNANPSGEAIAGQDYVVRTYLRDFEEISRNSFVYRDGRNRLHQAGIRRIWRPGQEHVGPEQYAIQNDRPKSLKDWWTPLASGTWTLPAPLVRSHMENAPELEPLFCNTLFNKGGWGGKTVRYLSHFIDMSKM